MHILLVESQPKRSSVIGAIPPTNIALMKWARWAEKNGHTFQYIFGKKNFLKQTPDMVISSLVFSFYSQEYRETLVHYKRLFPKAKFLVGGAFPTLNKKWFEEQMSFVEAYEGMHPDIENLTPKYSIDPYNKKIIGYASRGCPNKCGYCMVSKLEGPMKSFPTIRPMLENGIKEIKNPTGVVLYDNNFTAHQYFDNICDELEHFGLPVDIHGLHVSAFNEHHAERFARLKWSGQGESGGTGYLRFSFDFIGYQKHVLRALKLVEKYKIKSTFFCYLLYNWQDTPADFWNRIVMAQQMADEVGRTVTLYPQRYEPLNALERNKFTGYHWDKTLVKGISRFIDYYFRGFMPMTTSHNMYKWLGNSQDEFFDKCRKLVTVKNYKIIKNK